MAEKKDNWDSADYQHSASFVPKLAGKVTQWLDLKEDDVVLDIGCGDGVLDAEFGKLLAQGKGSLHGIDSSAAMIKAAEERCEGVPRCTFEVLDANKIPSNPSLQSSSFTKVFSNAALHWVFGSIPASQHLSFFQSVHSALQPGGTFTFEMGGLGNVSEMRTALLIATARRVKGGMETASKLDPWFFPDEAWTEGMLKQAGFKVDKVEREWRPTTADKGGVEGWVRLMGKQFLDGIGEEGSKEREEAVREAVEVLRKVCAVPGGGEMLSYVRLRCSATKV